MANYGCSVLGVDIARNAIELAKRSANYYGIDNATFKPISSFSELNESDEFDFVLIINVIEHIADDYLFLKKIHGSMKSGARLLLSTGSSYSSTYLANLLLTGEMKFDIEVGHLRRYTKEQIQSLLELAGFRVSKVVFSDGVLRDWFIVCKPLRIFNLVWSLPYIRRIFNGIDRFTASLFFFPGIIFVHAQKE